jgi:hypothetical protein
MAYDEKLAVRIRKVLDGERFITERKMFGGTAFLQRGNMLVGIVDTALMARVGKEMYLDSLARRHVREMDFTGKPMQGHVFVDAPGVKTEKQLRFWLQRSKNFVATLPAKAAKS